MEKREVAKELKAMVAKELNRFTEEEQALLQRRASEVWEYIGGDVLQLTAEQGEGDSVSRAVVIEMVLDAGRMQQGIRGADAEQVRALVLRLEKCSYAAMKALVKPAFRYARYGN